MLVISAGAFSEHLVADLYRCVAGSFGVLFICFAIKVSWLRYRYDKPPTTVLALAWLANAVFALATTVFTVERFGKPFDPTGLLLGIGAIIGFASLHQSLYLVPRRFRRKHSGLGQMTGREEGTGGYLNR